MSTKLKLLRHLQENGGSVTREALSTLGIPGSTMRSTLSLLREEGSIERYICLTDAGARELAQMELGARRALGRKNKQTPRSYKIDLDASPTSLEITKMPKPTDVQLNEVRRQAICARAMMADMAKDE